MLSDPTFSLFLVRPFNTKQLIVMIMQGLTLQLMVFGEDDLRGHLYLYLYFKDKGLCLYIHKQN